MDEQTLEGKFQVEALRTKLEVLFALRAFSVTHLPDDIPQAKAKLVVDGIKECRKREYIFTTASADFTVPILTEMQMP
jgi:hypothetical protein